MGECFVNLDHDREIIYIVVFHFDPIHLLDIIKVISRGYCQIYSFATNKV